MSDAKPAATDPLIGKRFGSYVVERLLGSGGMGAVYLALQPEIGKQVAIKFLAPSLASNQQVVQRFFAEAKAVNLIQHDNIVDIFDYGQDQGYSYFVMEFIRGNALETVLKTEGKLGIARTVDVCIQIADAVSAAHARGIVHRDLKPDNVFLVSKSGRNDFVKLLDFGIAKLLDNQDEGSAKTMSGAVLGTPGYMSPEQATGRGVDTRTDIYALGIVMFRMLAGRLPFPGSHFAEILQKQLFEPPPAIKSLRPEVPESLAAFLHQLIAREAEDRPQTMAEVHQRLINELPQDYSAASGTSRYGGRPSTGQVPILSGTTLSTAAGQHMAPSPIGGSRGGKSGLIAGIALTGLLVGGGVAWFGFLGPKPHKPTPNPTAGNPTPTNPTPPNPTAGNPTPTNPIPTNPTPVPVPVPVPVPAANPDYAILIESEPSGAEVRDGNKILGTTPYKFLLVGDKDALKLHLSGYKDEKVELDRSADRVKIPLRKASGGGAKPEPGLPRLPKPPATKPGGIGIDD